MKTLLCRIMIVLALFFAAGSIAGYSGLANQAHACKPNSKHKHEFNHISACEVKKYLESVGFTGVENVEKTQEGHWQATGWKSGAFFHIIVFVENDQIIGHEEFPQ